MPIGNYTRCLYSDPVARLLRTVFGTFDLHTHYRVTSVVEFFKKAFGHHQQISVLEVGCGTGTNLFELAKRFPVRAEGYDLDAEQIREAREISRKEFENRIQFHVGDARSLVPRNTYDAILFVDFLEHVPQPEQIVAAMGRCLKPAGVIVISVPTPLYPRVFGREMHERIGHLLDGYTAKTLSDLLPPGYYRVDTRYNTGPVGSLLCAVQCRVLSKIRIVQLRWLCSIPLLVLSGLDFFASPGNSATLFAVYRKPAEVAEVAAAA